MRTNWLRFGVPWVLLAVACSDDADDPFDDGSLTAGDHGDTSSASASASDSGSSTAPPAESSGDDTTGTPTTGGASEDDGDSDDTASDADVDTGPDDETGTHDDGESSTTEAPVVCEDLGECQPCVDCTVQPGGDCQDEALACQGDAECSALAGCYNDCATMFMGDELMTCVQGCYDDHPGAVAAFQMAYQCFVSVCGEFCM